MLIYHYTKNKKRGIQMSKKKIDKQKLVTRIVAAVLAGLMVLSIGFTLIWYLVAQ